MVIFVLFFFFPRTSVLHSCSALFCLVLSCSVLFCLVVLHTLFSCNFVKHNAQEDEDRHLASQRLQPAMETLARVQGMVEVAGLEEDEKIAEAYEAARRAIDGAVETIHSGDLASAKAAVEISLERTEAYEHTAKREKVRVERDRLQRNECQHDLSKMGQRIIAVETLASMLSLDSAASDLSDKIRDAQSCLRVANKSVGRSGSNDYLRTVQEAKIAVEAAELSVQREKERRAESERLREKMTEERRQQQAREAEYERQRQVDAAVSSSAFFDVLIYFCVPNVHLVFFFFTHLMITSCF